MSSATSHYRSDIDGLRAIAVLAVVAHHLSYALAPGGYVGVDVFFVISGYLITKIISREIQEGRFSFMHFYERRVRRIFPALFAMLGVTLVVGYFLLLPSDYASTFRASLGTVFFSSNIVFWKEMAAGYFAADAKLNPLLHTWSLAVEEQFYLLYPMFLLMCFRFLRRQVALILSAVAAVSLLLASLWLPDHSVAVFFLSPFRAWELLVGALLALGTVLEVRTRLAREMLALIGLLGILLPVFWYDTNTAFPGLAALPPVLGSAALIHAGKQGAVPTLVTRLLQLRPMVYIGLISYSLYLWHWPLIVLTRFGIGMDPISPYVPVLFATSLVLGGLSYRFIEQPFRHPRGPTFARMLAGAGTAVIALTAVSLVGMLAHGLPQRVSARALAMDNARTPTVPVEIRQCQQRLVEPGQELCQIGPESKTSSVLLWGDSHLMAWMPAMEDAFRESMPRAVLAPNSACPPFFGVDNPTEGDCYRVNNRVKEYLVEHPEIRSVVLSAFWSTYLHERSPITIVDGASGTTRASSIELAFQHTIDWMHAHDISVILVGPVPVYDRSVPLALALEADSGRQRLAKSYDQNRADNAMFYSVADRNAGPRLRLVDPAAWICKPQCQVQQEWVALYRDANHLSIAGALAYRVPMHELLRDALTDSYGKQTTSVVNAGHVTPRLLGKEESP